jgi:dTDP-4-dehydrorhamnose reductase
VGRRPAAGVYHCVNTGAATWETVAREAARLLGVDARFRLMTLADVQLTAPRPKYCALSNAKLAAAGIAMPTWQDALHRYLESRDSGLGTRDSAGSSAVDANPGSRIPNPG